MDSDSDRDDSVSRRSDRDALLADDGAAAGSIYGDGNEQAYGSYGGGSYGSGGGGAAGRGPRGRPRVMQLEDTRADRDVWGDGAAGGQGQGQGQGGEAPDRMGFWRGGGMMAQGGRKSHHAHTLSAPALSAAMSGGGGGAGAGGAASSSSALDAVAAVPPPDKSGQGTHKRAAACRESEASRSRGEGKTHQNSLVLSPHWHSRSSVLLFFFFFLRLCSTSHSSPHSLSQAGCTSVAT